MRITNFEAANQFVKREYRKGWGELNRLIIIDPSFKFVPGFVRLVHGFVVQLATDNTDVPIHLKNGQFHLADLFRLHVRGLRLQSLPV